MSQILRCTSSKTRIAVIELATDQGIGEYGSIFLVEETSDPAQDSNVGVTSLRLTITKSRDVVSEYETGMKENNEVFSRII